MGFTFYFVLRDFLPIPREQNVFVALHLGFSVAKFIGDSQELYQKWTPSCSKTFCSLFCSMLSLSFCGVLYYIIYYFREVFLINFLDFKSYCFSLYIGNLFYTILQHFYLFLNSFIVLFFYFITILITYTILHILFNLVRRRFVENVFSCNFYVNLRSRHTKAFLKIIQSPFIYIELKSKLSRN